MTKQKWTLDPTHSEIGFKVKHLMFTNISGKFNNFELKFENENDDFTNSKIELVALMDSINTNNEYRDEHLKSEDFFDVKLYPQLKFISTKIEPLDENSYKLIGDLTIKSTTKPVELLVESSGLIKDPWGNTKLGFSIDGKINRNDFGITWNANLDTGGVLVGEDIKLSSEIQIMK